MIDAVMTSPKSVMMTRSSKKVEELEKEIEELERLAQGDTEGQENLEPQEEQVEEPPKEEGLTAEEATFKKRYGDLRRYQQEQDRKHQQEIEELKKRLDSKESLPVSKEQVEAWVRKYPDIAGIVKSLAGEQAREQFSEIDRRTKELEEMREEIAKETALKQVLAQHPDFHEISGSDKFHKWAQDQSPDIQAVIYDKLDPKGLNLVLKSYKADVGIKAPKKTDSSAALSVSTRSGAATPRDTEKVKWSESRVAKLTDAQFAKYENEIMEAMRDGSFVYDMKKSR
jgi:anion-transporting  ArsA/GET3 family ATPase